MGNYILLFKSVIFSDGSYSEFFLLVSVLPPFATVTPLITVGGVFLAVYSDVYGRRTVYRHDVAFLLQ